MDHLPMSGKTAVVTGGGRGIGRGISEALVEAGARVLIAQRHRPEWLPSTDAGQLAFVAVDLADDDAPARIAEACGTLADGLDVLVNNAGIMFELDLETMTLADWNRMHAVNVRAPVFVAQALLPLLKQRGGNIVNISSIEGLAANPQHVAYCAGKGAVHALTRAMAVDLGHFGIRCNAIAPGWIQSDLSRAYIETADNPDAARRALQALHPAGRLGQPSDIGRIVVFLASGDAAFITGQTIVVDGGRTARLPLPDFGPKA